MIEPATWVPMAVGIMPAATAAAEPDDDPPGEREGVVGVGGGTGMRPAELRGDRLRQDDGAGGPKRPHGGIVAAGKVPAKRRAPPSRWALWRSRAGP